MFQQIIDSLPPDPAGVIITLVVAIGIGIGTLTALLGALHSRVTIALLMLSVGAVLGYTLPGALNWNTDRSVLIAIGSVSFGLTGFILHRLCVALALGAAVAVVASAVLYDQTKPVDASMTGLVQVEQPRPFSFQGVLESGSPSFRENMPWVALTAFVCAGALGLFFQKFGMAALYSLSGTALTLFCIRLGHASDKITWLDSIKTGPMTLAALGMAMLLVGFMTQFALLYRNPNAEPKEKPAEVEAAR